MMIVSLLCDCWLKGRFDETDVKFFIFFSSSLILSLCITMQSSTALILLVILSRERDFNFMQYTIERIYSFITSRINFITNNITQIFRVPTYGTNIA